MANKNNKTKVIALSALVASTTAVVYANKEAIKNNEEVNVDTAKLVVDKIDKDKVKISVENVNNASKAFQLSLKIDGNVVFKDGASDIKWLTTVDKDNKNTESLIENDYILSDDKKSIDIFVASNSELQRDGSKIEICEINLEKLGKKSTSDYKIVPNTENSKVAFKSIDMNNKSLEVSSMDFDDNTLKFNTPPVVILKETLDSENKEAGEISYPSINTSSSTVTIKEGYEFKAKSFVDIKDEEDNDLNDSNIVVKEYQGKDDSGNDILVDVSDIKSDFKVGRYKLRYIATDKDGENSTLNVDLVVEPNVWKTAPTLTGIPDEEISIYTGDVFDPYKPDNTTSIKATDKMGKDLEVKLSGEFDLEKAGTYTLTYTATDKYDNTTTKELVLEVKQNNMPEISGIDKTIINRGEKFDPLDGVSATDDGKEVDKDKIKVSGNVNSNISKKYILNYEVSDDKKPDLKTTRQREVVVNGEPTISGNLSYMIVKTGDSLNKDQILNGVIVEDDIDDIDDINIDVSNIDTSKEGTYKAEITATDSSGLTSKAYRNIIVTNKNIVELPESSDGSSEEKSKKMRVLDGEVIKTINDKLSSMTKEHEVLVSKTNVLDDVVYKVQISPNKIAFEKTPDVTYLDISVPKDIDAKTGGIVITQHESIKVSSITVTGNDSELKVGESKELKATINPSDAKNKGLLWTSSNNDIVSVVPSDDDQNATIKALKKGTSTIRVAAIDGSEVYQELVIEVGEQPKTDTQAPTFDYKGKTEISLANGMEFKTPYVTASDNVDTGINVKVSIVDEDGYNVDKIDTIVPGKYTIKYTASDKSDNKAELVINVTVKEAISNVTVGSGNASKDSHLEINALSDVGGLNTLLDEVKKDDFEAKVYGEPTINKEKSEATYTIKLYKREGLLSKLFNLRKEDEVYYLKLTVKNDKEFTDILSKLPVENPPTGGGSGGGTVTPEVPETTVQKMIGSDRFETAVKISKEGWNSCDTVIVVNGNDKNIVDGLTATPLASAKNAPILLSLDNELPKFTVDEIKRLNPSKVIVIGGDISMPNSIIESVKKINSKIDVQRIGGETRYETSLNIAKEIDRVKNISKIYVGAGYGEADSLSISPVAGRDKAPIILTEKDGLDKDTYEYIKSQNVVDGYIIGGEIRISDKAIKQIDGIVSKDISGNRIAGAERQDTNAKIISKFYTDTKLKGVVVAKDYDLVDALTVGPLAAKKDMPVVLATNNLSKTQEDILVNKKSEKIYETGGGIKTSVIDKLKQLVNNRK